MPAPLGARRDNGDMTRLGVYPGSFNPPTLAHEAIIEAAMATHRLDRLDLAVSRVALAKEHVIRPRLEHRVQVLEAWLADRPCVGLVVTDAQLLVDIAAGYDVLVVGADKYQQLHDPSFYGSEPARDAALARLPTVAVVPRPPHRVPAHLRLAVDGRHAGTSSSAARAGARQLMVDAAAAFDRRTGAWTDPDRYERWLGA